MSLFRSTLLVSVFTIGCTADNSDQKLPGVDAPDEEVENTETQNLTPVGELAAGMTLTDLTAGSFSMGSPETEERRYDDEALHTVELSGEVPKLDGELIVTVFDEAGQTWMGHSPVAELKQFGGGDWSLSVPAGTYVVEVMAVGPGGHHAGRVAVTADQDGWVDVPLTAQAGVGSPGHPPAPPRRAPTPPG